MIVFGPWCVYRLGIEKLLATSAQHLGLMLGAGVFNLAGFLLITMSLQLITVVRVNVISNAFTTALTVAAGIVLFQETCNRQRRHCVPPQRGGNPVDQRRLVAARSLFKSRGRVTLASAVTLIGAAAA